MKRLVSSFYCLLGFHTRVIRAKSKDIGYDFKYEIICKNCGGIYDNYSK
jgi:hypothetical protein